jgi:hypothetical protein
VSRVASRTAGAPADPTSLRSAPRPTQECSRPVGEGHPLGLSPAVAVPRAAASTTTAVAVTEPGAQAVGAIGAEAADRPVPEGEPLPAHVLADIARGFAAATPLWSTLVRHDPAGRRPVRLIAAERYEVWVIGWTTGQNVRLHDHGDSVGALVVTEGELTEVLPGGRGGPTIERTLEAARLRHLALGTVHDVVNRAPAPATSIHVYSPPLTSMTYYDPDTLEPVETGSVEETSTALAPDTGAVVLHPSTRSTR